MSIAQRHRAGKFDDLITGSCVFDSTILSAENDIGDRQLSLVPLDRNRQCVNIHRERERERDKVVDRFLSPFAMGRRNLVIV